MRRTVFVSIIMMLVLVAFVACHTPAGRSSGEVVDDATITTKVKTKLLEDNITKALAIDVDTFEGTVTMSGAVDTDAQRTRAIQIAQGTRGVKKVQNLIKLKGR
ncbi:MAG: BON domain-containing protein [Syntrophorhabdaceae bacterium]